ncbi:sugar ABC transporter permease [Devosia limi DSM 17137]|uniref:Multiple sugar transport system permease protein n=1 Tax=Devosia limi DSM 17137 TaxID=1121477 RepID=A0A0F5LUU6_9HYPH|nr:carbohydrate ABC transporter permease [Devosia limi]KKB86098.1 sugar ABC transporter permease [Devosia limi DSM 17137]SHF85104.1 multiple sugar transport system permease protein [Devosia limi DSM 17137]
MNTTRFPINPGRILVHVVLITISAVMVVPFVWMVLTAFKSMSEATAIPVQIFPSQLRWENFLTLFNSFNFGNMYLNSMVSTLLRVTAQVSFCAMAGYAFARLRFPGRDMLFAIVLSVMMVPPVLYIIPKFLLMTQLGWVNTLQGFVVPGFTSAFGTFLLRQFFKSLPNELAEAAKLDGCGPFRTFFWIMLPLAKPGIVAFGIFSILWSWNELLWPLIILNSPDKMTLSVGLATMEGEYVSNYPAMMAGAVLAVLPMIAMFFFFQRQFIEGIALTGSKG